MTRKLQERIREMVDYQKENPCPHSTQIVGNTIILKNPSRIETFEQTFPHFICYCRAEKPNGNKYFDPYTETLWRVIILSDHILGYRFYGAIIDTTIDDELIRSIVIPCMTAYCRKIEFFD